MKKDVNLAYRKSRYERLKNSLEEEYRKTIEEIDTMKTMKNSSNYTYGDLIECSSENTTQFTFIDLFSGAGGMSLGFEQAGFKKLCDVEILPFAVETLIRNFPEAKHYNGDIATFNPVEFLGNKTIHLVVGGPPCQGFSVAGKRRVDDKRNYLFEQYLRVVKEVRPYSQRYLFGGYIK